MFPYMVRVTLSNPNDVFEVVSWSRNAAHAIAKASSRLESRITSGLRDATICAEILTNAEAAALGHEA